ncbi:tautomerase family protein [Gorillibacterium sp. sgz5001074]|uniref:tautomerase family protein n=1 Tax=Gorillibacterium sp. sgz5001074 TaxID=3446695 RepID=UPI003F6807C5
MPFITVKALDGKTTEQKRELVRRITDAVSEVFEVEKDVIFIFFEDLKRENYGKKGDLFPYVEGPGAVKEPEGEDEGGK